MDQESLQIVQKNTGNVMEVSNLNADSMLDYSKDENSFSFEIEDQRKKIIPDQMLREQQVEKPVRNNIFQKYKKNIEPPPQDISNSSNSLMMMKIFDEVFGEEENKEKDSKPKPNFYRPSPERKRGNSIFGQKKIEKEINPMAKETRQSIQRQLAKGNLDSPFLDKELLQKNSINFTTKQQDNFFGNLEQDNISMIDLAPDNGSMRDSFNVQLFLSSLNQRQQISKPNQTPFVNFNKKQFFTITQPKEEQISIILPSKNKIDNEINKKKQNNAALVQPRAQFLLSEEVPIQNISLKTLEQQSQTIYMENYRQKEQSKKWILTQDPKNVKSTKIIGSAPFENKFQNICENDTKIPFFMQKLHRLNQVFPNFELKQIKNEWLQLQYQQLRNQMNEVLQFLTQVAEIVNQAKKSVIDSATLVKSIKKLKSEGFQISQGFQENKWVYDRLQTSLKSYFEVIKFYSSLSLSKGFGQKQLKNYVKIRQKLWVMQSNLLLIAKDIYSQFLSCIPLPHVNILQQYLQSPLKIGVSKDKVNNLRELYSSYVECKRRSEAFALSETAPVISNRLLTQLKFACPL